MSEIAQPKVHVSVAVVDAAGRLLLVCEQKVRNRGKWNTPGGHVELGESILSAARRELREETFLELPLAGLIRVISSPQSIRFVFRAAHDGAEPSAGHEVDAVRWWSPDEIRRAADDQLVSPVSMRLIASDVESDVLYPLDMFTEIDLDRCWRATNVLTNKKIWPGKGRADSFLNTDVNPYPFPFDSGLIARHCDT